MTLSAQLFTANQGSLSEQTFFLSCFFLSLCFSQVALHVLSLHLVALRLVCNANILHQGAIADGSLCALAWPHAIMAAIDEHVPLLGDADRDRRFGDVREVWQSGDMVQQTARLYVWGIAVGVAVLLLDVSPELPAFPLL